MMKAPIKTALAVTAALLLQVPANAATFACNPTPLVRVGQSDDGDIVAARTSGFEFYVCNLVTVQHGVSVEACRSWYSQLLTAFALNREVKFFFDTAHPANGDMTADCPAAQFSWNWRVPYLIETLP